MIVSKPQAGAHPLCLSRHRPSQGFAPVSGLWPNKQFEACLLFGQGLPCTGMSIGFSGQPLPKLEFLQPLIHYIRPIFEATTPADHNIALTNAQAYLDGCLTENTTAAIKLASERSRLHLICAAPQYQGRFCAILCEDPQHRLGHQPALSAIESALRDLQFEESLISQRKSVLARPLHCRQPLAQFHVLYPTDTQSLEPNRQTRAAAASPAGPSTSSNNEARPPVRRVPVSHPGPTH